MLGVSTPGEDFRGGRGGATTAAAVAGVPVSWRFCKMAYELELEALSLLLLVLLWLQFWGNFWPYVELATQEPISGALIRFVFF